MKNRINMTTLEMEISLAEYFSPRVNMIIPNVSWGFEIHECDLLVISKSGYATEIEIKVSKSDLIKDQEKRHQHDNERIKYLYFAIPHYLGEHIKYIPDKAGIILVQPRVVKKYRHLQQYSYRAKCEIIRSPQLLYKYKFSLEEKAQLSRLCAMRIWKLKGEILSGRLI